MNKPARKSIWDTPESSSPPPQAAMPVPPVAVAVVDQLRVAEKKQRNRTWEKETSNRPVTYRGIPPQLQEAIKEIAADLLVNVDEVARAFLEFGLQCYQKGEFHLTPVLSNQRLTLFPASDGWGSKQRPGWFEQVWDVKPPQSATRRSRRKGEPETAKPWQWRRVSYRGLPSELQAAIRELHQQHFVPIGEVVTMFLGHSLEAYQTGRLVLNPQPRSTSVVTFSEC